MSTLDRLKVMYCCFANPRVKKFKKLIDKGKQKLSKELDIIHILKRIRLNASEKTSDINLNTTESDEI